MVFHEFFDDGHDVWLDREYFYDSEYEMRQKTDKEYADDLEAFLGDDVRMRPLVIIPPECASLEAELIQRGVWFMAAENEVAPGIQTCSQMMSLKRLHIHEWCEHVIKEIGTYAWDEKKAERGLEEPVKSKDDCVDCMRYGLHTKIAPWRLAA
jgi:phage terminase large subunit